MLLPVSHGFIKDWNMEMSDYAGFFSLHSFGFMKDEKTDGKKMLQTWGHILHELCVI